MGSYAWIRTPADPHRPMVSYSDDIVPGTTRGQTRTVQVSHLPGQYPDEDLFDFMTERTIVGVHHSQPGAGTAPTSIPTWSRSTTSYPARPKRR